MKIHLVRHAETVWHAKDKYSGKSDIELTENGMNQSLHLAKWAQAQNIDAIYTSELSRAIVTAKPTAQLLNLAPIIDSSFNEVDYGQVEGLTKVEFEKIFPELWREFQNYPADTQFPSGETGRKALNRSLQAIHNILQRVDTSEVLVVSHGTLIRLILTYLLDQNLNKYRRLFPSIHNTGVTTIALCHSKTRQSIRNSLEVHNFNHYLI